MQPLKFTLILANLQPEQQKNLGMLTSLTTCQFHETRRMEIMKLFKKALLATAIFGAVGVNAAVLSSDALQLSAEGVAAGKLATSQPFEVDFVVKKLTPSASVITLTFDDNVDLSKLASASEAADFGIVNDPAKGIGKVGTIAADDVATPLLTFSYGTGSFTFDRLTVDADDNTIVFEVNLGNPVTAESAFRMSATALAEIDFKGASVINYSSVDADGVAIETGSGVLAETTTQFAFEVTKEFDGRIQRALQDRFVSNGDDVDNATVDEATFYISNNEKLGAALTVASVDFVFEGNFDNKATGVADETKVAMFTGLTSTATTPVALDSEFDSVTFSITGTDIGVAGTKVSKKPFSLTYTGGADGADTATFKAIPVTGGITAKAMVTADKGSPFYIATNVDAGEWALDAVIVNIPYFPVGFEGLDTSVHFANESANDAEVLVTAIDQAGKPYKGVLADLAGNTVTKYSQTKIMEALKAPAGSKLSVTFNIDANEGNVQAYAFSNSGTGRQALVTSQQNGK